jgi:hypothetical protein
MINLTERYMTITFKTEKKKPLALAGMEELHGKSDSLNYHVKNI